MVVCGGVDLPLGASEINGLMPFKGDSEQLVKRVWPPSPKLGASWAVMMFSNAVQDIRALAGTIVYIKSLRR